MKKIYIFFVIFFISSVLIASENQSIYPLENISDPWIVEAYKNHLYIADASVVKVFSMKDFKYEFTIGKVGEGPGEFLGVARPKILPDYILISSRKKIAYYTHNGEYIKERRHTNTRSGFIKPVKDNFVNFSMERIKDNWSIYSSKK